MDTSAIVDLLQATHQAAASRVIKEASMLLAASIAPAAALLGLRFYLRRRGKCAGIPAWQWVCFAVSCGSTLLLALLLGVGVSQYRNAPAQAREDGVFYEGFAASRDYTRRVEEFSGGRLNHYLNGERLWVSYEGELNAEANGVAPRIGRTLPKSAAQRVSELLSLEGARMDLPL